MQQARDRLYGERHEFGRLTQETSDRFRHDAPFLRPRTPLDQHFKIELLACKPLKCVLADGAELILVHVSQHLAHHVKDGVVLQRVANFLQLFKQSPQNVTLDGVGRDEVENQTILPLAVAVDASHPLL